ncbi:MAG: amino acid adenylation domain-containing protein, partial [Alphaproteobacteria bacterium]|nr:amino acid adenylation domain-containing protein [Alphaproteobacteria bacterium]
KEYYRHYLAEQVGHMSQLKLPPLTIQYKDFALWQRNYLTGDVLAKQLSYWKQRLEGYEPLHLHADYARPAEMDYQGRNIPFELDRDLSLRLREAAKSLGVSLYSLMLACYYLMLRVYAGQDDIVIGSPVANRHYSQIEHLIGFFVNTLALRINVAEDLIDSSRSSIHSTRKLRNFIKHIGSEVLEAQLHQDLPFEKLVEELSIPKDTSRHPIFQVMFSLNSFRDSERDKIDASCSEEESVLTPCPLEGEDSGNIAKFDLETFIDDESNSSVLKGGFIYRVSLYKEDTVKRFINTYKEILLQVAEALTDEGSKDNFKIEDFTYLTQKEKDLILTQWNNTDVTYPCNKSIHQLFEEQVEKTPDKIALTFQNKQLSYATLNSRSNQLSHFLQKQGLKLDSRVGISAPRGIEFVTGMFAILKLGSAYVPLDPEYPEERLNYMLEDAGIEVLLTVRELSNLYEGYNGKIIYIDDYDYHLEPTCNLNLAVPSDVLAYVIYTSGSTGNPKGVGVCHQALINVVLSTGEKTGLLSQDIRLYAVTSTSFDVSGLDYYLPLINGGLVCISSTNDAKVDEISKRIIFREQVNCIQGTPSYWTLLTDNEFKPLQNLKLLSAGEPLTKQLFEKLSHLFEIHDLYGPTETTVYVTHHRVKDEVDIHSIGSPLFNTQIYILDQSLTQVPIGAIGQIFIGGDGLARGYINRPGLTAEKFIANPFSKNPGERLYGTGDLGRYLPNGNIEFLGRADQQVKMRGFRIELGEIENTISSVRGVEQVIVLAREDEPGQKRLVAYVVPSNLALFEGKEEISQQSLILDIRNECSNKLPDYMRPSQVMLLEKMPLTPNGKINRKALPIPEGREGLEVYQAPEGIIENSLASIWKELLQVERVGRNDNFFYLGGHSLIATRLISKIRQNESIEVPLRAVFEHPVLCDLAHVIEQKFQSARVLPSISKSSVHTKEDMRLSFSQERLWFIEKYEQGTNAYNIPIISKVSNTVSLRCLEKSIKAIVDRHEILRTIIIEDSTGSYYQEILETDSHPVEILTIRCTSQVDLDENIKRDVNHIYDLSNEYPIRVRIYSLENSTNKKNQKDSIVTAPTQILSIVIHHIAFDGWSTDIFMDELNEYYKYFVAKEAGVEIQMTLAPLPVQYKDFALWQRSYLRGDVLEKQLSYWKSKLEGYEALSLPTDFTRPAELDYEGKNIPFELDKETSLRLREAAKSLGVSLYSLMLSCYYLMLRVYTDQDDIVIGSPVANRHYSQIEHLIGLFVNTLALRINIEEDFVKATVSKTEIKPCSNTYSTRTLRDFIKYVSSEVLDAQLHQDLPFEKLVEELGIPKDTSRHPIFQVMFGLQSFGSEEKEKFRNSQLEQESIITPYISKNEDIVSIAKFDLETFIDDGSSSGVLRGSFNYRLKLYKEDTIKRLINTYKEILSQVAEALTNNDSKDNFRIEDLVYLTQKEKELILTQWNNTDVSYPRDKTIHQLFEEQVERDPDSIALIYENKQLSYGTLNSRSNQLSHLLYKEGVALDSLVGISVPRGLEFVIGMLAILKAGGAYLPLDPKYPEYRLSYMLEDAGIDVLLTVRELGNLYQNYKGRIIYLDDLSYLTELTSNLSLTVPSDALAYVIYTSGSTGKPKGVGVTQGSILNHMKWIADKYFAHFTPYILQRTNPNFDASVWELFLPLLVKGKMVIATDQSLKNPQEIKIIAST